MPPQRQVTFALRIYDKCHNRTEPKYYSRLESCWKQQKIVRQESNLLIAQI